MVPMSDAPLEFEGHLVYELSQTGRTSVGELRWGNDGKYRAWSDAIDRKGFYNVHLDPARPLASFNLERRRQLHDAGHDDVGRLLAQGRHRPPGHTKKLDKTTGSDLDTLLGQSLCATRQAGKARGSLWVAAERCWHVSRCFGRRATRVGPPECARPARRLHGHVLLPEGLPLKVEWGAPLENKLLANGHDHVDGEPCGRV